MPVAGPSAADRAEAHYRWAERYTDAGYTRKAAAHFGRALDFGELDEEQHEKRAMEERTAAALIKAYEYVNRANRDEYVVEKLKKMNMGVIVDKDDYGFYVTLWVGRATNNSKKSLPSSTNPLRSTTVGQALGYFKYTLTKCAQARGLDDVKQAYMESHIMGRAYRYYIKDFEKEQIMRETGETEWTPPDPKPMPIRVASGSESKSDRIKEEEPKWKPRSLRRVKRGV